MTVAPSKRDATVILSLLVLCAVHFVAELMSPMRLQLFMETFCSWSRAFH